MIGGDLYRLYTAYYNKLVCDLKFSVQWSSAFNIYSSTTTQPTDFMGYKKFMSEFRATVFNLNGTRVSNLNY